jgi:RNA polymerase sigma factor for flagellar operon FliA
MSSSIGAADAADGRARPAHVAVPGPPRWAAQPPPPSRDAVLRQRRDALVLAHLDLVKSVAGRLASRLPAEVEVAELVGVGTLGLIEAAGRFRASLRVPFSAFARRRIHGAMVDALREGDSATRAVRRGRREVDRTTAELRHRLGAEPSNADIAAALDLSEEEYDRRLAHIRSAERKVIRLDGLVDVDAIAVSCAEAHGPHARLERKARAGRLAAAVAQLPERERTILKLYFDDELTLAQIGAEIGVGESRVSQLRTQALAQLRAILSRDADFGVRPVPGDPLRPAVRFVSRRRPGVPRPGRGQARDGAVMVNHGNVAVMRRSNAA